MQVQKDAMISELKHIILFFLIGLIPVENNRFSERVSAFSEETIIVTIEDCGVLICLSDKINELVSYISGNKEHVTKYEESKPYSFRKNGGIPTPFFLDIVVRTTDWFSHFKVTLSKLPDFRNLKDIYQFKTLSYQYKSDDVYIPPLKYYVYTLKKIIT